MNIDESWKYLSPTKIVFGLHSFDLIKKYVLGLNIKQNVLLVTGKESMKKFGYVDRLRRILFDRSIYHYDQIPPNPTQENISEALRFVGNTNIELVIALGGGSVIDAGKTLAVLLKNPGSIEEYLQGKTHFSRRGLPFIAVPTTAGTASEVTCWATLWDMQNKKKYSLSHEWMFPQYAIIDPCLTVHMSTFLTACTGMDALTHAIESCWSRSSQPISDVFALRAIHLVRKNIKKACEEPDNLTARRNMSLASLFAGLAFNNTKTAACHSLSYPMTMLFNIPHGLAVSITIKEVIKYNYKASPEKVQQIIEEFGVSTLDEFNEGIVDLMKSIELPIRLRDLNLNEKNIDQIMESGINPERLKNNLAELSKKDIRTILMNSL
jgi:alcohol dehydrogenase